MATNNTVTLIGNLGADPLIRKDKGGKEYAVLSLATTDSYQDRQGNWQHRNTIWHTVFVRGLMAVGYAKQQKKGNRIEVKAALDYRPFPSTVEGRALTRNEVLLTAYTVAGKPLTARPEEAA